MPPSVTAAAMMLSVVFVRAIPPLCPTPGPPTKRESPGNDLLTIRTYRLPPATTHERATRHGRSGATSSGTSSIAATLQGAKARRFRPDRHRTRGRSRHRERLMAFGAELAEAEDGGDDMPWLVAAWESLGHQRTLAGTVGVWPP